MRYKTSEILRALKLVVDKPFYREDIVYAKEHRDDENVRKDLTKIPQNLLDFLENYRLISGKPYQLTEWGSALLKEYEEAKEEYGIGNVEVIPTNKNGITTYKVKINPKIVVVEQKPSKTETQPSQAIPKLPKEYTPRKEHMINFLSELKSKNKPIKNVKEKEGFLIIKTGISYHRTIEERNRLDEIAKELKMKVKTQEEPWNRNYIFINEDEQTSVTIVSGKEDKKGFKSVEPLEIKVNLNQSTESAEKLINFLIEKFPCKR